VFTTSVRLADDAAYVFTRRLPSAFCRVLSALPRFSQNKTVRSFLVNIDLQQFVRLAFNQSRC
jgi:hypothetical protein